MTATVSHFLADTPHYAVVDIVDAPGGSSCRARLVGRHVLPRLSVGPVVGRVTSNSAVVLYEVDTDAPVRCLLTDVFTNETRAVDVDATACVPFVVCYDELMDDRR